ncbi:MAG: maleylpyruvate isomerase family mycothiol-dependent enzyme [Candidatus Nanopelagicales bacterium]|jgi:uncharacterized protein (TIGR03083 family)|nr:maleylpyruvate isomerase family mycothiol-dependent enzyme [Candidatus Nanopelagicales bacterium]MDP4825330.1 maleylpyruvate isomerase family mycothiol-dependent enzyme [Candidatus Nanopelagicales bacterium]MDP4887670.1 maleylpyruvate isomerase family mycothiol-dependent enzyme [Candidatus Nanopelagicales bacterium]
MAIPVATDADLPTLIACWQSAHDDFLELIGQLSDEQWTTPTDLPGWTVADVVAHVVGLEKICMGEFDPPHEPDWAALDHVKSDSQKMVEVSVDLRRSNSRTEALAEATDVLTRRGAGLQAGPQDADTPANSVFGPPLLSALVRQRTMDTWVHEQDIRRAVHRPGNLGSVGAQTSATQLMPALPMLWGKRAGATAGQTLHLDVVSPGVVFQAWVGVSDEGRASFIDDPQTPATVQLTVPWEVFAQALCGRGPDLAHRDAMQLQGDEELGERFATQLSVTP